jgi:L-asparaginase/Glu-tRNA(Gln) amidotransferase subunit D
LIRDPPTPTSSLVVHKEMNPNVGVLKLFPGITQATIKNFLQEPLEGITIFLLVGFTKRFLDQVV